MWTSYLVVWLIFYESNTIMLCYGHNKNSQHSQIIYQNFKLKIMVGSCVSWHANLEIL